MVNNNTALLTISTNYTGLQNVHRSVPERALLVIITSIYEKIMELHNALKNYIFFLLTANIPVNGCSWCGVAKYFPFCCLGKPFKYLYFFFFFFFFFFYTREAFEYNQLLQTLPSFEIIAV